MATAVQLRVQAPPRLLVHAELAWIAFVVVQVLDGALSYVGVSAYGLWMEGNPLVAWYAEAFGPAVGFAAAKLFALGCGAVLYATGRFTWLAVLAVIHIVLAVLPWTYLIAVV